MLTEQLISKIIRSRRRTLGLEITADASLIVRAPLRISEKDILKILERKRSWILEKQQKAKERTQIVVKKQFVDGEEFLYLGSSYKLRVIPESSRAFEFNGSEFVILQDALPRAKRIFEAWYILQAKELIQKRVEIYAQMAGQNYTAITITSAKTRWGSCTSKRTLNFTWRLIMAPLEMIDYVVAHEVAHLEELNHSHRFWNKVKSLMPDYRHRQQWFKSNQQLMSF